MQWSDDALVIGLRHHGETGAIVELLTAVRGRHLGFVHGGRSRRLRPVLQPGNSVRAVWQARTDEALGSMAIEALDLRAARIMASALSLHMVNLLCSLARLLPEREDQPELYAMMLGILHRSDEGDAVPADIVRFELTILRELGFGLDLDACAVTGESDDLAFVSPKTGRAVSRKAGEPFRERILLLPRFLLSDEPSDSPDPTEVASGFALTEHFLLRHVFGPRGQPLPDCRRSYLAALTARGALASLHSS